MKPSFHIYNVLRPLGWLYGLGAGIRNIMYDNRMLKSQSFSIPVISIGNITVGGTGKTPHTEYLAGLLKEKADTAVLSRGYGRRTKGFILSDTRSCSGLIGDEPLQIKRNFPDIDVAVCEDRAKGIKRLIDICNPRVIILDDAFQHRSIKPSLNILLVNYHRNILDDAMLPAGRLRESAKGRRRADVIIVSKCPSNLPASEMDRLESMLAVSEGQQVFFTTLEYGSICHMDGRNVSPAPDCPILAVTGIAFPEPMIGELRTTHNLVKTLSYPDHHSFSRQDLQEMESALGSMPPGSVIVTTAKDAARLSGMDLSDTLKEKIFVLPVKPAFLRDQDRFDNMIIGAANCGGDSDAIAAMAGAMFGAWFGLASIPEKWFEKLEGYEEIKLLACNIYRIAIPETAV